MRPVRVPLVAALLALAAAAPSAASPVLVLHGRHVTTRDEPFAGPTELPPPPRGAVKSPGARPRVPAAHGAKAPPGRGARQALDALLAQGQIDQATHDGDLAVLNRALRAYRTLGGTRRAEVGAVIANADAMGAGGLLTASRLPPVFATLDANTTWWTTGRLLGSGARVSIGSSQVIWQYYPGQGIELQQLANWGKANGLFLAHKSADLRTLLDELIPLAADRGGWPAWEYYFRFGGGRPPWTSAISQGTAIQALARATGKLKDPTLSDLAERALAAFEQAPPNGVRQDTPAGAFYLIYTFAPDQLVINAHLQAVTGLYDFWQASGSPRAQALFQQGDAEARTVLPRYDTGSWSLYDQRSESDLSYHQLVTTFLRNLCNRLQAPIYCDTADRFTAYESEPPIVTPSTRQVRAGAPAKLGFSLDKISRVGVIVSQGGRTVFSTSAVVGRGSRFMTWSRPVRPGAYQLRMRATDLAGNQSDPATATLRVLKPKGRR